MTWKTDLRKYLEDNGVIGKPEDLVQSAVLVLQFFRDRIKKHEPFATVPIGALDEAANTLDGYEDDYS